MEQPRSPFGRSAVPWDPASSHSDSRQFKFDGVRISGDEARLSKRSLLAVFQPSRLLRGRVERGCRAAGAGGPPEGGRRTKPVSADERGLV